MKFLLSLFVCVLVVSAFADEDDKKVDKRDVVIGSYGATWDPWLFYGSRFYNPYNHGIYKRDTSAHSVQKRDVAKETDPKTQEKRDLILGYGDYPYFRNYPYYTGYKSYPDLDYYRNYDLYKLI